MGRIDAHARSSIGVIGRVDIRRGRRHQARKCDFRLFAVADRRRLACTVNAGDWRGVQSHVVNRAGFPADLEPAVAVDRLLFAVSVDVLRHPEGDVRDLQDRHKFLLQHPFAVPEWERPDVVRKIELVVSSCLTANHSAHTVGAFIHTEQFRRGGRRRQRAECGLAQQRLEYALLAAEIGRLAGLQQLACGFTPDDA
jgi:hypothetical protein